MKFFHYERRSSKPQRGESNGKEEKRDASLVILLVLTDVVHSFQFNLLN